VTFCCEGQAVEWVVKAAANKQYARLLSRGFGGALLFAFPLLMTMEMWELGFAMERERLLILLVVSLPVLLGLSYFSGFEQTFRLKDEILDALAALAIGMLLSASMLAVFGVLSRDHPQDHALRHPWRNGRSACQ